MALARNPSPFLYSLEHQLTQEYNTTLHQEYLFWRLKYRNMWLNYGDANTKYFHLKTIQRRSQSRVITLKDDTGLWLNGESLTHHIHTTFKKLFRLLLKFGMPPLGPKGQFVPIAHSLAKPRP